MLKSLIKLIFGVRACGDFVQPAEPAEPARQPGYLRHPFIMVPEWQFKKVFNYIKDDNFQCEHYQYSLGETALGYKGYYGFGDNAGMVPFQVYFSLPTTAPCKAEFVRDCGGFDDAVEKLWHNYLKAVSDYSFACDTLVQCHELEVEVLC